MADRPIPARSEVPEESTWNLKDVFESDEAWQAEYDRLAASGLSATLYIAQSSETGSATVAKNFDQKSLLWALTTRRAELDSAFDDLINAPVATKARRRLGYVVRLGD